jgi:hypothetical protein
MSRARQMGMLTYRGRDELDTRFGKLVPGLKRPPVAEYLDYHGQRFAERFPVRTFLLLSEAIDRAAIGDDAHSERAELAKVTAETVVVGVPGDMLFPWPLQVELHRELQAVGAHSSLWKLDSVYGHDASQIKRSSRMSCAAPVRLAVMCSSSRARGFKASVCNRYASSGLAWLGVVWWGGACSRCWIVRAARWPIDTACVSA